MENNNLLEMSEIELKINYLLNEVKMLEGRIEEIEERTEKNEEDIQENYDEFVTHNYPILKMTEIGFELDFHKLSYDVITFETYRPNLDPFGNQNWILNSIRPNQNIRVLLDEEFFTYLLPTINNNYEKLKEYIKKLDIGCIKIIIEEINIKIDNEYVLNLISSLICYDPSIKIEIRTTITTFKINKELIKKIVESIKRRNDVEIVFKDPFVKCDGSSGYSQFSDPLLFELKQKCNNFKSNVGI